MEKVAIASIFICLALYVRGDTQTQVVTRHQIQPFLSTPVPFAPSAFPGTIQPSNLVNPISSGGFLRPDIIPSQSQPFLPIFGNPPQQQQQLSSNIFLPNSGFSTDGTPFQIPQSGSTQNEEPLLNNGQSRRFSLSDLLADANGGSSHSSKPPLFSTPNPKVNTDKAAEKLVSQQNHLQGTNGSSTPPTEGSLTTALPLSSPPTEATRISQTSNPKTPDSLPRRNEATEGKSSSRSSTPNSDNDQLSLSSHIEQLKMQLSQSMNEDGVSSTPLDTEGQESITHITEDGDNQTVLVEKRPLFQNLAESQMIGQEFVPSSQDDKDKKELLLSEASEVSDSLSITTFDTVDPFQETSANQGVEQENSTDKRLNVKDNNINDTTDTFYEDTTILADDYDDYQNPNQDESVSIVPDRTTTTTAESQSTKDTIQLSPREDRTLRQARKERLSSREKLIERLKKLRERRLSTTRPHIAAQRKEIAKSDDSNSTIALKERRLNNNRRFDRRRDNDFYNRLRNRVFTTRAPNGTRFATQEKESPIVANKPTTKKPLSFRDRLNRYRENNRFIPRGRRPTTPRSGATQPSTPLTTKTTTSPVKQSPTTSLFMTEEINTDDSEWETETTNTFELPSFATEPTSRSKVQEIMDKIAATISQKGLKEKPTTEEELLALNDVTDKPLPTELFSFITTTSDPFDSTADIDFNSFHTTKIAEEIITETQIDELQSTVADDVKTSGDTPLPLATSPFVTNPSLHATFETPSTSIPSLQLSTISESDTDTHFAEDTTESSLENIVSSSQLLNEALRSGNVFMSKAPISTTEMIIELDQGSPKGSVSIINSEQATDLNQTEIARDSTREITTKKKESSVDEASIQALIAKLIAQGVITEAKQDENLAFTTEKEDDETIAWEQDSPTTQPTMMFELLDKTNDVKSIPNEARDGSVETHGPKIELDFSKNSIPTTFSSAVDIENVPVTFVPFISRTTVDQISSNNRTVLLGLDDISPLDNSNKTKSHIHENQGIVKTFGNFFVTPSEQPTIEELDSPSEKIGNEIEVPISESMDHLQTLLRTFGSSSIRPELSAVNRVIGLSLFDPPSTNNSNVDTNLEEPELLNDYAYYDYDLETAATEQVIFTTELETLPFETQTPIYQALSTENTANTQDITVSENLVPTVLNMDITSISVSEPSVIIQNFTEKDMPSNITDHMALINETVEGSIHNTSGIIQINTSDSLSFHNSNNEKFLKGTVSEVVINEPQHSPFIDREESIDRNSDDIGTLVIFEDGHSVDKALKNDASSDHLENDEGNEVTETPLIDTTPFIAIDEHDIISKNMDPEHRMLEDGSVMLSKHDGEKNMAIVVIETTTTEPFVVKASDSISQNTMTEDKMPHNAPTSFLLRKKVGQEENISLPEETKESNSSTDRHSSSHSVTIPISTLRDKESSSASSSQSSPDARSKAIVRERPDLLLILRNRDGSEKKLNENQHLSSSNEATVSLSKGRLISETVTHPTPRRAHPTPRGVHPTPRARLSLSQLLSQKAASGTPKSEPVQDTNINPFHKFLIEVTTEQPLPGEKEEHTIDFKASKDVSDGLEQSKRQDTSIGNANIQVSNSKENQNDSGVTETVTGTSKTNAADEEKELALRRFLALNREMLKSLRNGRKTTPNSSVTKNSTVADGISFKTTTVSSVAPKTRFHEQTEEKLREPHGSNTENKPTTFIRPVPQPRLFNISSIGSLLLSEKPGFGGNQPPTSPRKGPTQFLRPSSLQNSTRIHVTPGGRVHFSNFTTRFLDSKVPLKNISHDINTHLPRLPRPTQHDINNVLLKEELTTKSPTIFIPFNHEPFVSATTTNAPFLVSKDFEGNSQLNQRSDKSRAQRVSTLIPTSPRPSRGQFTTLASLIKSKTPTTFKPDITTPSQEIKLENDNDFTTSFGQNIENFPSTTNLPYFAEDEEDTTQLGPLDIEPMTISPDEFETTIIPKAEEHITVLSDSEGFTPSTFTVTSNFEAHKTGLKNRDITTVVNENQDQNFRPSRFFSRSSTTSRPQNSLNPNTSFQRKEIVNIQENPSLGFFKNSHSQGMRSGNAPTTERSEFQWKPVTLSNLKNKFGAPTTTSPFSFSDIFTTDSEPESVTILPTRNNFGFDSTTSFQVLGQNLAGSLTTGTQSPTVLLTTLPSISDKDGFFTERLPLNTFENKQFDNTEITERVPVTTVPAVSVTPKIILLALPVINASTLQGTTTLAPKVDSFDPDNHGGRIPPSQLLRHDTAKQNHAQVPSFENEQNSNLRDIFLASLPPGTIPQKHEQPKTNIFHGAPQAFPRLQQSVSGGVSIRAEEGIIPRDPLPSQQEFQKASQQQQFSADGFITTTPSPLGLPATTQGLDGASVDNDPDSDHIPGEGGVDYPVLDFIPETSFRCTKGLSKSGMMYADPETACQVYHICNGIQKFSFLCPRGTIFHQETVVCQWWYTVDCKAQARKLAEIEALGES